MDFEEKVTGHQPVFSGHLIDVEVQDVLTPAGNHATGRWFTTPRPLPFWP